MISGFAEVKTAAVVTDECSIASGSAEVVASKDIPASCSAAVGTAECDLASGSAEDVPNGDPQQTVS